MAGFNTKNKNRFGEYEITFYTENKGEYEAVQEFCRKIIEHEKPSLSAIDLHNRLIGSDAFID
jgi:hypothetical protein